ncbi:MAG: hypothetical protein FJX74_23400, partial [Armatimonadetes bacterium]|nr:hypothetical protein [Armatimonadota bacterium]
MDVALIVNPVAGRRRSLAALAEAEAVLAGGGWHVSRRVTDGPDDARRLATEAAREGAGIVFACGGDGTLSQVVEGLLGTG